jgi:hypothetical protein
MSGVISAVGVAAAVAGTAYGIYNGQKQDAVQQQSLKKQTTAEQQAVQQQLSTERQSEIAQNKANQKTPDIAAILAKAAQASKSGVSGTMLTGTQGIDPSSLNLGKTTLLGS